MTTSEYKGFEIRKFQPQPKGRASYRIYSGDEFKESAGSKKKAKMRIDFCTEKGLWNA